LKISYTTSDEAFVFMIIGLDEDCEKSYPKDLKPIFISVIDGEPALMF
jgi:hypothetical protein